MPFTPCFSLRTKEILKVVSNKFSLIGLSIIYTPPRWQTLLDICRLTIMALTWIILFCMVLVLPAVSDSNYTCPTWFYFSNITQRCECGVSFRGISCYKQAMEVEIRFGYCATFSGQEGLFYAGHCPYSYKFNHSNKLYSLLPSDPDLLNEAMCGPYNRKGLLCGECIDGYGPGVYTLDRKCVDCSKFSMSSAICLYLLVEFVPVLLFFLCVTIFRLDITSGPMLGYVMVCQMMSYFFESLPVIDYDIFNSSLPIRICIFIDEFWSLKFCKTIIPPFCISEKLIDLHVIFLNCVGAIYPLLIAIISLFLIDLHSRQYKVIVILFKPLGFVLKLTNGKAITTNAVIHSFASFLFLSSTKMFFVFMTIIQAVPVISSISGSVYKRVLYSDPSIEYYSHKHILFFLLALIQCLFLVFLPSLLLFLYPTRLYRWISQFISARKQLAITTFVEALNHGFKDGLNGTRDYRAFAGFLIVGIPMFTLLMWVITSFVGGSTGLFAGACLSFPLIYFRPFKSTIANMSVGFYSVLIAIVLIAYDFWILRGTLLWQIFSFLLPISQVPVLLWALYNLVCYIRKRVLGRDK